MTDTNLFEIISNQTFKGCVRKIEVKADMKNEASHFCTVASPKEMPLKMMKRMQTTIIAADRI